MDTSGSSTAREMLLMRILSQVQAPALHDSAWLGPFEQLVGAAYSLIESEKRGFSSRAYSPVYHPMVQCKIVSLLEGLETGKEGTQQDALDNWLSRYYFNSGIQRVTFAVERLIATFAALPCKCGTHPADITINNHRAPNFQQRITGAKARLGHVETEYAPPLTNVKAILGQLTTPYYSNDPFDASKGLAMMRRDVNNRKHSVYKRAEVLESLPRPVSGAHTWSEAGCNTQMTVAVASLELVVGAYSELLAWYPLAKF